MSLLCSHFTECCDDDLSASECCTEALDSNQQQRAPDFDMLDVASQAEFERICRENGW